MPSESDPTLRTAVNRKVAEMPALRLPPGIRGRLAFVEGPEKGRVALLEEPWSSLGRHPDCTVVLQDTSASSKHAEIYFAQSREWRIGDLGSTNGTLLNGSVVKEYVLKRGDKIMIGSTLMVFDVEQY